MMVSKVTRRAGVWLAVFCVAVIGSSVTSHAGVFSNSVRQALAGKAARRLVVKETTERGVARTRMDSTVTTGAVRGRMTEKKAAEELAAQRAASQRANRLYREGKITWAEKNSKNLQYDAGKHAHGHLPVRTLSADKQVQKYYPTVREARAAVRNGIKPNRHMTATTHGPGRESFKKAQLRYGLTKQPTARVTIQMHKGQQYIATKVVGGGRGVSENLPLKKIPPEDVGHLYLGPSKRP